MKHFVMRPLMLSLIGAVLSLASCQDDPETAPLPGRNTIEIRCSGSGLDGQGANITASSQLGPGNAPTVYFSQDIATNTVSLVKTAGPIPADHDFTLRLTCAPGTVPPAGQATLRAEIVVGGVVRKAAEIRSFSPTPANPSAQATATILRSEWSQW